MDVAAVGKVEILTAFALGRENMRLAPTPDEEAFMLRIGMQDYAVKFRHDEGLVVTSAAAR